MGYAENWLRKEMPKMRFAIVVLMVSGVIFSISVANAEQPPKSIDDIVAPGTEPQVIGTGYGFCEGPAADAEGNVYFSDGKNDSIYVYRVGQGVELFVSDSTDANGMMFNSKGELYVCEGAARRIVAIDIKTKKKWVLADRFQGTAFNEPNDLTIDRNDGFYFTDPNYRHRGQPTLMKEDVYYVAADGTVSRVSQVCIKPNGILLTPDNKTLYLADNAAGVIYRYDVAGPGQLTQETKWIALGAHPDGLTLDEFGNLYVACGRSGIKVYTKNGEFLGIIALPYASNCVFGGKEFRTLFVTSADKFYAVQTKVRGMLPPVLQKQ